MHLKVHISSIFGLFKYTLQLLHHTLPFSVIPSQSNLSLHLNTSTSSLSFLRNCCFISKYMTLRTEPLLLSHFSRVRLCATPETAAHQAPPSLGFSRQEHWGGLPFPSPRKECGMWDLPRSGIEPLSPALAGRFYITEPPGKPCPIDF